MPFYLSPPPRNPLTAVLAAVGAALVAAAAFFLGFIALVVALGLGLLIWIGFVLRLKWLRYRMRKTGVDPLAEAQRRTPGQAAPREYIEAEYTVVSRRDED
jgi:fatty acid desaturase